VRILSDLIGPTSYVKALNSVANESYPAGFTQGVTITIGSVAGSVRSRTPRNRHSEVFSKIQSRPHHVGGFFWSRI
jgi:hypothetical protein